jgi:hypothetical protein
MNEKDRMPRSLSLAYDKAANWVVTVTRTAESYLVEKKSIGKCKPKTSVDITKVKCFNSGKFGHYASSCPLAKKGDGDESALAAKATEPSEEDSDNDGEEAFISVKSKGINDRLQQIIEQVYKTSTNKSSQMYKYSIGIDSMCSAHLFGNREFVTNVRACTPIKFKGIGGF